MQSFTDYILSADVTDDPRGDFIADTRTLIELGKFEEPQRLDCLLTMMRLRGACDEALAEARRVWGEWTVRR